MRGSSCSGCDSETCGATLGLALLCPAFSKAGCEEPLRALGWGQEEAACAEELLVLLAGKAVGGGKGKQGAIITAPFRNWHGKTQSSGETFYQ